MGVVVLQTVERPAPGVRSAIVIAGSDKRGTIYGIYDVSEQIGVSPWYWWADVVPDRKQALFVRAGRYDTRIPGKLQFGAAWWFLDHAQGIAAHFDTVSTTGLLARFVGMVTDSRSVLSYSRHEYFRRLLCNLLGNEVRRGLLPDDRDLLGRLVQNVCFANARDYFGFALGGAAASAERP
jgi:glucuronate isomerase